MSERQGYRTDSLRACAQEAVESNDKQEETDEKEAVQTENTPGAKENYGLAKGGDRRCARCLGSSTKPAVGLTQPVAPESSQHDDAPSGTTRTPLGKQKGSTSPASSPGSRRG